MSWLARWRPALRIARRDAWQHKGRSVVVLVMVALPVIGVVGMDTVFRTADVSPKEGLSRTLGTADAVASYSGADRAIQQIPDELSYNSQGETVPDTGAATEPATKLAALLPSGSRLLPVLRGDTHYKTALGQSYSDAIEVDPNDPLTTGMFDLKTGRFPQSVDEVAVSRRLVERGYTVGSDLHLTSGATRHVVGTISWPGGDGTTRLVVGVPGAIGLASEPTTFRTWLVDTPAPLRWRQIRRLNHVGYAAVSRDVVLHPPPPSQVEAGSTGGGIDSATLAVIGMIAAMAALEIVLLAGPAFAVGLRKQQRSLALLAATGGRPRDVRRVVLGGGIVLGGVAAIAGVAIGVAGAWLAMPVIQRLSTSEFGPFQVSWRDTLLVAAFGLLSAVLAAVVPAFAAARQDVVAVLAGRRGQTRTPIWSPVIGALLLAGGIAITVAGAAKGAGGETLITGGAIPAVLGMVLLIPLVVAQLGRLAGALPLTARFAVRDASRHRSRTAPAVAAVAATVAGVIALGIGGSSDGAQNKALHTARAPMGAGVVQVYTNGAPVDWSAVESTVKQQIPGARVTHLLGVPDANLGVPSSDTSAQAELSGLEVNAVIPKDLVNAGLSWSTTYGASALVGAKTFDAMGLQISAAEHARAIKALAAGKVVLFANNDIAAHLTRATLLRQRYSADGNGATTTEQRLTAPAIAITAPGTEQPAAAVLPESVVAKLGFTAATTSLLVNGMDITSADEDRLGEALTNFGDGASFAVERGFHDNSTAVALLVLGCVGGVLVLGGTLTATFLALSDARPDFATMGAIGAAPRTRRGVAASYAATIGLVGATLGAVVGFIPGIAVTYPLTSASWAAGSVDASGAPIADHFLDIPWLLVIGLVIGLPTLTAGIVGLTTRSRLPMVSRLP